MVYQLSIVPSFQCHRGDMTETYKIITGVYGRVVTTGLFNLSKAHQSTPEASGIRSSRSGLDLRSGTTHFSSE